MTAEELSGAIGDALRRRDYWQRRAHQLKARLLQLELAQRVSS